MLLKYEYSSNYWVFILSFVRHFSLLIEKIENNFDKYTEKEIKELTARFSELEKKLEAGELSENEKKELKKMRFC